MLIYLYIKIEIDKEKNGIIAIKDKIIIKTKQITKLKNIVEKN